MADTADIFDALFAKVGTLVTGSPSLPVAYPEVAFDPPADGKYLAVSVFTNRPAWEGLASGKIDQGILQIDVVWPKNQGLIAPAEIADLVKAHFARPCVMQSGTAQVRVSGEPWCAAPLIELSETRIPVSVRWVC